MFARVIFFAIVLAADGLFGRADGHVDSSADNLSIPDIVKATAPAVVAITAAKGFAQLEVGSGFIIDPSGLIATNEHVIVGATSIEVTFNDGSRADGRLVAASTEYDLALVKVDAGHRLPTIRWGDSSDLQVGESVCVIGNPFGLGTSVSAGIVSALNRSIDQRSYSLIQTDAAVNRGNSGGPLLDRKGDVVGMTSSTYEVSGGGSVGIGFAIPSGQLQFVANRLLFEGRVRTAWIGALLQDVTPEMSAGIGSPRAGGALVSMVWPDGAASRAGIRAGDLILEIDGHLTGDMRSTVRWFAQMPIGQTISLVIFREGRELSLSVVTEERPMAATSPQKAVSSPTNGPVDLGLQVQSIPSLTDEMRRTYGLDSAQTGVVVTKVDSDSSAAAEGLTEGDVIFTAMGAGGPFQTPADLDRAFAAAVAAHRVFVNLLVRRPGDQQKWVALRTGIH